MTANVNATTARPASAGFLNNLQALRAYAAMSVVFLHFWQACGVTAPFGSYGVDVFFVLSGYLMTRIAATDPSRFMTRRLIRIVPIYWACTLAVYALGALAPSLMGNTRADLPNLIRSLCFIPYRKDNNAVQPLLYLGWTLNYEMYFYAVYALALRFWRGRAVWIALALVCLPPLVRNVFHPPSMFWQFYGSSIVLEFVLGMLAYQVLAAGWWKGCPQLKLGILALALIALPCLDYGTYAAGNLFVFGGPENYFGRLSRLMVLGLPSLVLVFLAVDLEGQGRRVRQRTLLLVGNASYLLYLVHPYLLKAGEKLTHFSRVQSLPGRIGLSLVLLAATVSVACLLHLYLEKPVQKVLHRWCFPKPAARKPAVAVEGCPKPEPRSS